MGTLQNYLKKLKEKRFQKQLQEAYENQMQKARENYNEFIRMQSLKSELNHEINKFILE